MDQAKKLLGGAGAILFLCLCLLLFIKGMFHSIWHTPDTVTTYSVDGVDGRSMTLLMLPGNLAYFVYTEPNPMFLEAIQVRLRGHYGTNYFGNIWNIDRSSTQSPLGIRVYSDGVVPVILEADILGKYLNGNGNSSFPEKGEQMNPTLLISPSMVEFQGMPLTKVPNADNLTQNLMLHLPLP